MSMVSPLIMQFGTSRFLQAHVDYFVGQSLASGRSTAPIAVVQTSGSASGKSRVAAMNECKSYPVRIQGLESGKIVNSEERVSSIECALQADNDWGRIVELFCQRVTHVVSNTADNGYQLVDDDRLEAHPPRSFPAKLLSLLLSRYEDSGRPVVIMPCELIANNGQVLKNIVLNLANVWQLSDNFINWLEQDCLWVNSLVDRIVSQSIEPVGAVAEPYALWAIEDQPGLTLPCEHPAIRLVKDLAPLEWLKLGVLNLSHTYLVDLWLQEAPEGVETVCQAMHNERLCTALDALLENEVIPILKSMALGEDVAAYAATVRERFLNPFLEHKLVDIAQNHVAKIERRLLPLWDRRQPSMPAEHLPRLSECLRRHQLLGAALVN